MLFKDSPKAFNGVVLAVIRGVINELNRKLKVVSQLHHAVHKLGTTAMVFWTIALQQHKRLDPGKVLCDLRPTVA